MPVVIELNNTQVQYPFDGIVSPLPSVGSTTSSLIIDECDLGQWLLRNDQFATSILPGEHRIDCCDSEGIILLEIFGVEDSCEKIPACTRRCYN